MKDLGVTIAKGSEGEKCLQPSQDREPQVSSCAVYQIVVGLQQRRKLVGSILSPLTAGLDRTGAQRELLIDTRRGKASRAAHTAGASSDMGRVAKTP